MKFMHFIINTQTAFPQTLPPELGVESFSLTIFRE